MTSKNKKASIAVTADVSLETKAKLRGQIEELNVMRQKAKLEKGLARGLYGDVIDAMVELVISKPELRKQAMDKALAAASNDDEK